MSYDVIRSLLESRLDSIYPSVETAWENVPFEPVTGVLYQRAFLLPASTENPTFGDSMARENGIFQVSVCAPIGLGSIEAMQRASLIRNRFYRGLSLVKGSVTVRIIKTPSIAPAITESVFYVIPVSISYFSDIF